MNRDAAAGAAGQRLAQYELLRRVGSGAMGVVYQARDVDLDRLVAIKLLHPAATATEQRHRHQRFLREARAAARLSHPNVATVFQIGDHDGSTFLAMEWLDGIDLAALLKSCGALPWRDAVAAIADAAAGLAAAHAAGLVHRDVKPSNLMRLADGTVKVVDFGLARWHDAASELTATGTLLGTPAYLSPEQCGGHDATPASDVYALGCTLFQLLAGRPPFPGPQLAAVLQGHVGQAPPALAGLVDGLPPALPAIVERMLAKAPAQRFAHAGALHEALRVLLGAASAGEAGIATGADAPQAEATRTLVLPAAEVQDTAATEAAAGRLLPPEGGAFIGRETEMAMLAHAMAGSRLVTLVGPGGTGKSRLALQMAHAVASRQPVWFVELAPLAAGHDAAAAVAAVLELREAPGQSAADAIVQALRGQSALLVLDNCEHVLGSAAALAARLAADAPPLQVIATSRQALGCVAEAVLAVPPLHCADAAAAPQQLLASDAVQLFAARAALARPGFVVDAGNAAAVAAICRRVDALPLAIELAAARIKVLSLAQIDNRLADALRLLGGGSVMLEPRQQTLRALIDWSWALLDTDEQLAFERCSVFAGDFGIDAAEAVLGAAPLAADGVLDLLSLLVDKSLLSATDRGDEMRYRLLETVRAYAAEKLHARGDAANTAQRHADVYAALAVGAVGRLRGSARAGAIALLARERDNVLAALRQVIGTRRFDVGSPLIAALAEHWADQGLVGDGIGWVERFLAAGPPQDAALAALLRPAGTLALFHGRHALALEWFERGLQLATAAGDAALQARCLDGLGSHARATGELVLAQQRYRQAIELCRRHALRASEARALNNLAIVHDQQGRSEAARELYEAALAIHRELGGSHESAVVQMNLATLALNADDAAQAEPLFASCAEVFRRSGDEWNRAYARGGLGSCALGRGDLAAAGEHFAAALAVVRTLGDQDYEAHALDHLARIALMQGRRDEARAQAERSLAMRLQLANPGDIATSLETLAWLASGDDPLRAARLVGCAAALRERCGEPAVRFEQRRLEMLDTLLAQSLTPAALQQALADGRAADPEALVQPLA